jgi:DNA-binding NarL/FixJ family response regulator
LRIVLVDDHRILREALHAALVREGDLRVVGEAEDGRSALELCLRLKPDIVTMDVGMPELNGIEATRRLAKELPATRVVALSMHVDKSFVHSMFEAGAWGYVVKNCGVDELVHAIRAVGNKQKYVSPVVAEALIEKIQGVPNEDFTDPLHAISPREREVLQLLAEGLTSKEIASRLDIAVSTVDVHRAHLMGKLGLRSVALLTKFAVRTGMTSPG